jgi:hypothetical protein
MHYQTQNSSYPFINRQRRQFCKSISALLKLISLIGLVILFVFINMLITHPAAAQTPHNICPQGLFPEEHQNVVVCKKNAVTGNQAITKLNVSDSLAKAVSSTNTAKALNQARLTKKMFDQCLQPDHDQFISKPYFAMPEETGGFYICAFEYEGPDKQSRVWGTLFDENGGVIRHCAKPLAEAEAGAFPLPGEPKPGWHCAS